MKDRKDPVKVFKAIALCDAHLTRHNLEIRYSTDFRKLKKTVKKLRGKSLSAQADLAHFDFTGATGFWLGVYDEKNKCVCIQAARIDQLQDECLADHWENQQPRIYNGGKLGKNHAPAAYKIGGCVAYHGDLWVDDEYRSNGISIHACRYGYFTALMKFNFDYIYAFMSQKLCDRGLHRAFGCSTAEDYGTDWEIPPKGIDPSDCLVYTSADNLYHLAHKLTLDAKSEKRNQ